jgi:hypothetical protein
MSTRFTSDGRSIRKAAEAGIAPSQITPPEVFFNRRQLIAGAVAAGLVGVAHPLRAADEKAQPTGDALKYTRNAQYSVPARTIRRRTPLP